MQCLKLAVISKTLKSAACLSGRCTVPWHHMHACVCAHLFSCTVYVSGMSEGRPSANQRVDVHGSLVQE